jgi:DNA-binding PucR family transcriptional regulator
MNKGKHIMAIWRDNQPNQNPPQPGRAMRPNRVDEIEVMGGLTASLISLRAKRERIHDYQARRDIASECQVPGSKLLTLIRGTAKTINGILRDQLAALLVAEIRVEIQRLNHEQQMALQIGGGSMWREVEEIKADVARLETLLKPTLVNSEND